MGGRNRKKRKKKKREEKKKRKRKKEKSTKHQTLYCSVFLEREKEGWKKIE